MFESKVCTPVASPNASWSWSINTTSSYSCASSAGGTNDLGTFPQMCENDLTSVRIGVTPGAAECLVANIPDCLIPMHDFISLDYDYFIEDCLGIWAAPVWMTPGPSYSTYGHQGYLGLLVCTSYT